jgi:hypothetical protein
MQRRWPLQLTVDDALHGQEQMHLMTGFHTEITEHTEEDLDAVQPPSRRSVHVNLCACWRAVPYPCEIFACGDQGQH